MFDDPGEWNSRMSSLEDIEETIRASLKLMVDDSEHVEVDCLEIAGGACLCFLADIQNLTTLKSALARRP